MVQNLYFILRHFRKQKLNTFVHIIGLTVGMTICIFIGLFLQYETNFEASYDNADRIFRVNSIWKDGGEQFDLYASPIPVVDALRTEVTGIKTVVLARPQFKSVVEISRDNITNIEHALIVQPEFLGMFNVRVVSGDGAETLKVPYRALLTQSTATRFFGNADPIGKTFKYRNRYLITVGGVIEDMPAGMHLPATMLLSYVQDEEFMGNGDSWYFGNTDWKRPATCVYIELNENTDPASIEAQLKTIADRNINASADANAMIHGSFELQAIRQIHFDTERFGGGPWVAAINTYWLWFFGAIGVAVLILGCINFLNLSTAQSFLRTKEIGLRKTLGARRSHLIMLFIGEALTLAIISGIIATILTALSIGWFNTLLDKNIQFDPLSSPLLLLSLLVFIGITGVLAGSYPAWMITRFSAVNALKSGTSGMTTGAQWVRKSLVVVQFVISAGLFIIVLIIAQQVRFLRNKDLGFKKDNILNVTIGDRKHMQVFYNDLLQVQGVKEVSFVKSAPMSNDHWWNTISKTEGADRESACVIYADEHFFSVYNLPVLSGRIPDPITKMKTVKDGETAKVVVNSKLLETLQLGTAAEAIGKRFWWGSDVEIVAVVADFNVEPLTYGLSPVIISQDSSLYQFASIRIEPTNVQSTLSSIEAAWKKNFTARVYEYQFLDAEIDAFYRNEGRLYTMFNFFSVAAILISGLGLWGLVSLTSQQRVKEICIRKMMGASVVSILLLLARDIVLIILIALLIAFPLTYFLAQDWLQNFAFRIEIGWLTFVIVGLTLMAVALFTVVLQSLKAALVNPVTGIREA